MGSVEHAGSSWLASAELPEGLESGTYVYTIAAVDQEGRVAADSFLVVIERDDS